MAKLLLIALLVAGCAPAPSVAPAARVKGETAQPIDAARFLVGRWVGEGMGGQVEESWSPPLGSQMVGHFRYAKDGKPVFYEIMMIREAEAGGLEFLVRHFNADFTAWEGKEEWVTFAPYAVGPGMVMTFKGLRIERVSDQLTATVTMRYKDGSVADVPFVMRRAD